MPTILYVEDNDDNMFIVHRRLTLAGFDVAVARNGQEGVAMAADLRPDLVVMDLNMPVLGGLEATRRLKSRPETRAIPIIALTAHADVRHRDEALAAGCDAFEEKPVDFRGLIARIHALLARPRGGGAPSAG
jgi:two-component system, cell cycle response regulator DivK